MEYANIDLLYKELKALERKVERTNYLLESLVPVEKVSKSEAARLRRLKAGMDAGREVPYSKNLF